MFAQGLLVILGEYDPEGVLQVGFEVACRPNLL